MRLRRSSKRSLLLVGGSGTARAEEVAFSFSADGATGVSSPWASTRYSFRGIAIARAAPPPLIKAIVRVTRWARLVAVESDHAVVRARMTPFMAERSCLGLAASLPLLGGSRSLPAPT